MSKELTPHETTNHVLGPMALNQLENDPFDPSNVYTSERDFQGLAVNYDGQEYRVRYSHRSRAHYILHETYMRRIERLEQLAIMSDKDLAAYRDKLQTDLASIDQQAHELEVKSKKAVDLDDPNWVAAASAQIAATKQLGQLQRQLNMRRGVIWELLSLVKNEIENREKAAAQDKLQDSIVKHKRDLEKAQKILQDHLALSAEMKRSSPATARAKAAAVKLSQLIEALA